MNVSKPFVFAGTGKYIPATFSSSDLEKKFGLRQGWSERYSGVKNRHHATFETNAYMGARAIENALADAKMDLNDVDLLISASATYDYPLPNQASVIKNELEGGKKFQFPVTDIDTTCLSFVNALEFAIQMLDGKKYRNIVIVSSEIASKGLDPDNWETLTLFGDAAAAVVISYDENDSGGYIKSQFRNYSEGVFDTIIEGGGNKHFFKDVPYDRKLHSFAMNGKNLLRLAKRKLPEFFDEFFDEGMHFNDCDWILPHQASKTGLMMFRDTFGLKRERMLENIGTHGNCIAASIPVLLHDGLKEGRLKSGDNVLLCGTSAGFSIGALLFRLK